MPRYHWRLAPSRRDEALAIRNELGIDPVVAHILLNRQVPRDQLAEFLSPTPASRHDFRALPNIDAAAERLATAVRERQQVVIYGDYDADGTTASAALSRFLRRHEVPFTCYLPDRFSEGYGVNAEAIIKLVKQRNKLIITVDCGVSAKAELDTALALGVDVIVADHHRAPAELPSVPVVNPQLPGSAYPFPDLCGCAVTAKLCMATGALLGEDPDAIEAELLDLMVIGTVADVMPLVGENRYLTVHGLQALGRTKSTGLQALMEVARLDPNRLTARDIGFGIGPRLNAAGRLTHASKAYQLLVTTDRGEAFALAEELEQLNRDRREEEQQTTADGLEQAHRQKAEHWGLVVWGEGWHEGVIGLVAGQVCKRLHRPTLAISSEGEKAKGSGRSTDQLDLYAAMCDCGDLFDRFGGHAKAAGFSLPTDRIPALVEQFDAAVRARLTEDDLLPCLDLECAVKGRSLTLDLARQLERLAPFGEGNREPLLEVVGLHLDDVRQTRDGEHLQLDLSADGQHLKGFWPRGGQYFDSLKPGREVKVAGHLRIDSWNGREQPQLVAEDLVYA